MQTVDLWAYSTHPDRHSLRVNVEDKPHTACRWLVHDPHCAPTGRRSAAGQPGTRSHQSEEARAATQGSSTLWRRSMVASDRCRVSLPTATADKTRRPAPRGAPEQLTSRTGVEVNGRLGAQKLENVSRARGYQAAPWVSGLGRASTMAERTHSPGAIAAVQERHSEGETSKLQRIVGYSCNASE